METGDLLCEAAQNGDVEKLKALMDSGADVTYFDKDGLTPLMHAAKQGHAEAVKSLLDAGAPWNALSPSNLSAGDFAMNAGHQSAFDLLLNAGMRIQFVLKIKKKKNLLHFFQFMAFRSPTGQNVSLVLLKIGGPSS